LPVWLPALLLTITYAGNVRMAHARPFSTSTFQSLFNNMKITSRKGVLTSAFELWSCGSPGGLEVPTFGSASLILTFALKWGYDTLPLVKLRRGVPNYITKCRKNGLSPGDKSYHVCEDFRSCVTQAFSKSSRWKSLTLPTWNDEVHWAK
jgi:hypothetical protein